MTDKYCKNGEHEYEEDYCGFLQCKRCPSILPPWAFFDESDEKEEYHSEWCTCETCLQNYPEREIYLSDEEWIGDEDYPIIEAQDND